VSSAICRCRIRLHQSGEAKNEIRGHSPNPCCWHLHAPFDHEDWIFELFLLIERLPLSRPDGCRLVFRNRNAFKTFPERCAAIVAILSHEAILDGESVHLGSEGKPLFYDLMRRRTPQYFYAFDPALAQWPRPSGSSATGAKAPAAGDHASEACAGALRRSHHGPGRGSVRGRLRR